MTLIKSNLIYFSLVSCAFVSYLRDHCLVLGHDDLRLCFFSKSFIVLVLTFWSWIHLEFTLHTE